MHPKRPPNYRKRDQWHPKVLTMAPPYLFRSHIQWFHVPKAARTIRCIGIPIRPPERFKTNHNSLISVRTWVPNLHSIIRSPATTFNLQGRGQISLSLSHSLIQRTRRKWPNEKILSHPTQQELRNVAYTYWTSPIQMRVGMEPISEYSRNLHSRKLLENQLEVIEYHKL
jgi:hypothetical protein